MNPSSSHNGVDSVSSFVDHMQGNSAACMSLCAHMQYHPFGTLTEEKTRSKSNWILTCISTSGCAWPPTHAWRSIQTLRISMLLVQLHSIWWCACYQTSWREDPYQCTWMKWRQEFAFSRMLPLSTQTPSQTTKLGISSPPSTITRMSKSWSHHNGPSVIDVLHGFL